MPKTPANERRLAKLLREWRDVADFRNDDDKTLAAFLARHSVLAVCAETVPSWRRPLESEPMAPWLRCLARGAK